MVTRCIENVAAAPVPGNGNRARLVTRDSCRLNSRIYRVSRCLLNLWRIDGSRFWPGSPTTLVLHAICTGCLRHRVGSYQVSLLRESPTDCPSVDQGANRDMERREPRAGRRYTARSGSPSRTCWTSLGFSPARHRSAVCLTRYRSGPPSAVWAREIGRGMHTNSVSSASGPAVTTA